MGLAYSRFQEVSNLENAIELAKALWDAACWLWSGRNPGVDRRDQKAVAEAFDNGLFDRCPDLRLFRDLAEAAKHGGELSRSSVTVKGISGGGSPGDALYMFTRFGTNQSSPECTLQMEHDGGSRDRKEALTTTYKFLLTETS